MPRRLLAAVQAAADVQAVAELTRSDVPAGLLARTGNDGIAVGNTFYFAPPPDSRLAPSTTPAQLWASDGTAAGTRRVADLRDRPAGSDFFPLNGRIYFAQYRHDPDFPSELLYRTDGTAAGTILAGGAGLLPRDPAPSLDPTPVGDALYLAGRGLWKLRDLSRAGNVLYFTVYDSTQRRTLWMSDGTTAGTRRASTYGTSEYPTDTANRIVPLRGNTAVFASGPSAHLPGGGLEPYLADGLNTGLFPIREIRPGSNGSNPGSFVHYNGWVYFAADDGVNGRELWRTDGTFEGTTLVTDVFPGASSSDPWHLKVVGGRIYLHRHRRRRRQRGLGQRRHRRRHGAGGRPQPRHRRLKPREPHRRRTATCTSPPTMARGRSSTAWPTARPPSRRGTCSTTTAPPTATMSPPTPATTLRWRPTRPPCCRGGPPPSPTSRATPAGSTA